MNPSEDKNSNLEDTISCQLFSPAMLRLPIVLQGKPLKAVVDTAATSTVVSDKVFSEMEPSPPCLKTDIVNCRAQFEDGWANCRSCVIEVRQYHFSGGSTCGANPR